MCPTQSPIDPTWRIFDFGAHNVAKSGILSVYVDLWVIEINSLATQPYNVPQVFMQSTHQL